MINPPRPTRQVVPRPTRELVPRQRPAHEPVQRQAGRAAERHHLDLCNRSDRGNQEVDTERDHHEREHRMACHRADQNRHDGILSLPNQVNQCWSSTGAIRECSPVRAASGTKSEPGTGSGRIDGAKPYTARREGRNGTNAPPASIRTPQGFDPRRRRFETAREKGRAPHTLNRFAPETPRKG
jgi:hypothetical protein